MAAGDRRARPPGGGTSPSTSGRSRRSASPPATPPHGRAAGSGRRTKALVPESFDDYLTDIGHALRDPGFVEPARRGAEVTGCTAEDPRIAALATDFTHS
ncbi:hypothetical protein GCM10022243_67060 [Saccharothrix violaceirubra]